MKIFDRKGEGGEDEPKPDDEESDEQDDLDELDELLGDESSEPATYPLW
jgi:hypothetical protein